MECEKALDLLILIVFADIHNKQVFMHFHRFSCILTFICSQCFLSFIHLYCRFFLCLFLFLSLSFFILSFIHPISLNLEGCLNVTQIWVYWHASSIRRTNKSGCTIGVGIYNKNKLESIRAVWGRRVVKIRE